MNLDDVQWCIMFMYDDDDDGVRWWCTIIVYDNDGDDGNVCMMTMMKIYDDNDIGYAWWCMYDDVSWCMMNMYDDVF